ncbi:MAG: hypothetical protein IPF99_38115 [Deltaproteobacteria bacterium]|nr:hypothetical protein [Deltaproteobacteria bacterium]
MATSFDSLAKEILDLLLHDLGQLETEVEVAALPSQRADVLFVPDPARDDERRTLGLLGRMTERAALFEPFHDAPGVEDVRACLRKILNHHHARSLSQRGGAERSWLLCAGRPDGALIAFRATPSVGWPRGFYDLGEALPLSLVVLSELDDSDDTLPLRLMGAGATLRAALYALSARQEVIPRGRSLNSTVVQVFMSARRRGLRITEDLMLDTTEAEEYLRQQRREGLREGLREGVLLVLPTVVRVAESRLARAVTDAEREALLQKIHTDGAEAVGDALVSLAPEALARWLTPPRG